MPTTRRTTRRRRKSSKRMRFGGESTDPVATMDIPKIVAVRQWPNEPYYTVANLVPKHKNGKPKNPEHRKVFRDLPGSLDKWSVGMLQLAMTHYALAYSGLSKAELLAVLRDKVEFRDEE